MRNEDSTYSMNKEIALDPNAAPAPRELARLLKQSLGPFYGRYISHFPADRWWDIYASRFEITGAASLNELRMLWTKASHDFARAFREENSWCLNVHRENKARPFHSIACLVPNDFGFPAPDDEAFIDSLAGGSAGGSIRTRPAEYVEACRVLLSQGPEVVLNDPYLANLSEHSRSAILAELLRATVNTKTTDFVIFSRLPKNLCEVGAIMEGFDNVISGNARHCKVSVCLVNRGARDTPDFHQRFLLTKTGGLVFDRGFESPPKITHNTVHVMPKELHATCCDQFIVRRHVWAPTDRPYKKRWSMPARHV